MKTTDGYTITLVIVGIVAILGFSTLFYMYARQIVVPIEMQNLVATLFGVLIGGKFINPSKGEV